MARRASEATVKDTIPSLRERVKELEEQLAQYKRRLDDLRKAKNTTILKREREVININAPNLGQRNAQIDSSRIKSLESQIEELKLKHDREINDLKTKGEQKGAACDHETEILILKTKITDAVSENAALMFENDCLKDQISDLEVQLSLKEASLCSREEQVKLRVEKEWQEKYQEWMARTEHRLEEVQQANNLMRTLLKRPPGGEPTCQDH